MHNGSHGIDLLRYLFGELRSCRVLSENIDYKKEDPTLDGFLEFDKKVKVHLVAGSESYYSIFEIQLLFSKLRITLEQFGLRFTKEIARKDPVFPGYRDIGDRIKGQTGLNKALLRLIDNVIDNIEKKKELFCSAEDTLKTQELCNKLIRDIKKR